MLAKSNGGARIIAGHKRCRPILVTISESYFMENCFARSRYLRNYKYPVNIEKLLSSTDCQLDKDILAKRFHVINVQQKKKSDFRIRNLKLYHKDALVDVVTKRLSLFQCALKNCRSVCSLDKRYKLLNPVLLNPYFWSF